MQLKLVTTCWVFWGELLSEQHTTVVRIFLIHQKTTYVYCESYTVTMFTLTLTVSHSHPKPCVHLDNDIRSHAFAFTYGFSFPSFLDALWLFLNMQIMCHSRGFFFCHLIWRICWTDQAKAYVSYFEGNCTVAGKCNATLQRMKHFYILENKFTFWKTK